MDLNRRDFLKGAAVTGAATAVAVAGLSGCAPESTGPTGDASSAASEGVGSSGPSWLTPPSVPDGGAIKEEYDCEVLVIGTGAAGNCAVLSATEAGAKVIGIDKGSPDETPYVPNSRDWGVLNSRFHAEIGFKPAPKFDLVNALVKQSLHRANGRLLNYYYDESGPMFDWLLEGLERDKDYEFLPTARSEPHLPNHFFMKFVPYVEEYDYREEYYPYFFGSFCTIPDSKWVWDNAVRRAKEGGAEYFFAMYAEQLIKDENGKVVGCYAKNEENEYYRFNASKAVILACGDIGSNDEMRNYYVPQVSMFNSFYDRFDSQGNLSNTGDGLKMALWAGAAMEIGPYAPMTHHAGGALGINAFLQVNRDGVRFMNEDIPGQQISNQLVRQPGGFSWQIFDDQWRNELASQPAGHNCINWWLSDEEAEKMPWIWAGPAPDYNITYDKLFFEGRPECMAPAITCYADTLEELAEKMEVDATTLKTTINRYNENCELGEDRDFGKTAKRLYPISTPPFYGMKFEQCEMLVCVAGINCDSDLHAMDADCNLISGLYVCGNNGGGRFLVEYPVAICGLSLASAAVMGKLAGENAARGI